MVTVKAEAIQETDSLALIGEKLALLVRDRLPPSVEESGVEGIIATGAVFLPRGMVVFHSAGL